MNRSLRMSSDFTSLLVKREGAVVSVHLNTPTTATS